MRWLAAIALAACSYKPPAPPSAESFEKMTADERCEATEPRAMPCVDALMMASVTALGVDGSALRDAPRATDDEARQIHKVQCLGNPKYADAVFACWGRDGCHAFADCVTKLEAR